MPMSSTQRRRVATGGLAMSFMALCAALLLLAELSLAFAPSNSQLISTRKSLDRSSPIIVHMGMNRRARRQRQREQERSRPKSFYDAIKEADELDKTGGQPRGEETNVPPVASPPPSKKKAQEEHVLTPLEQEEKGERLSSKVGGEGESVTKGASVADAAPASDDDRPEVSTVIVDEITGIERIKQGKAVMDVVTRRAVKLSDLGPQYRLAQMFPGVPPDIRNEYRFDWQTIQVPDMIDQFQQACMIPIKNQETGEVTYDLPPHPSVANAAVDFVLANRDYLGFRMKKTLGRLKLRAQSRFNKEEAVFYRKLWKHLLTLEDHISAPFRQMILDAENRVGPNFGNLDIKSYCSGEVYERCANYIVLKGMVAHWEKKVRDAEFVENTPQTRKNFMTVLATGDPKRYLPDPPILFRLQDVSRVCLMAQKMTAEFVNDPELFNDLPPELRFIEKALSIKGGTSLRQFMIEEFCPAEEITPAALREGLRRFDQQLENLQIDPYGDLKNTIGRLCEACAVGTDEERDPYLPYIANLDPKGPGYFQTYTFDHDKNSLVRFLDNAKRIEEGTAGPADEIQKQIGKEISGLFGFDRFAPQKKEIAEEETYKIPEKRACGRPHMLGWLDLLGDEEISGGEEAADSKTAAEANGEEKFESDNWKEVE